MGFLKGFITGLTNDDSVYNDGTPNSGSIIGDLLGGFVGGYVRGSLINNNWVNWVNSFKNDVNAESVIFLVKHKFGHDECTLIATIFDEDDNVIAQNSWEVEYDKEIKQLHKQEYFF